MELNNIIFSLLLLLFLVTGAGFKEASTASSFPLKSEQAEKINAKTI